MRKTFAFYWDCIKDASRGHSPFANDWQWVYGSPTWQCLVGSPIFASAWVYLNAYWGDGRMKAVAEPFIAALAAYIFTWIAAFFIKLSKVPASKYFGEKERADSLNLALQTAQADAESEKHARELAHTKAIEAQTAAHVEQNALLREQIAESRKDREQRERENSPLNRAIADQQKRQIEAALDPELKKQAWINALQREYIASHDNVSPAIEAGTDPPPADWMNRRLAELNKPWRV